MLFSASYDSSAPITEVDIYFSLRTMLELINQLDGFDPRGNIKVLMATNRPDTLDPALMRPGRLDRKVHIHSFNSSWRHH